MPKKMTKITTSELILSAIFYLQQKNGVTAKEITKYICEKRGCPQKHMKENVKKALERATVKGIFCRNRGLYRINNGFGLNKVLNNKSKGKGKKTNKLNKPKGNMAEKKTNLQICFEAEKESEPKLLNEMVDERMNDIDDDDRRFYVELPMSCDQDDDDDEDFEDTDDDNDDNDFFSDDDDENANKPEPETLFVNENTNDSLQIIDDLNRGSDCNSFNDPFKKPSRDEYPDNTLSEDRGDVEEETHDSEIQEVESEQTLRENSKELSENSSEIIQCNDENQSGDENQNNEEYGDQQEEMEWDCQLNDLDCIDRLLAKENYPMNIAQRKQAESDTARENTKGMKLQKNSSRVKLSIEDDPTDSFETSHMNKSTR